MRSIITSLILILAVVSLLTAQEKEAPSGKVYLQIPGASDKMNSEDIIQKLLFIKKLPIQKKELQNMDYKLENDVIKDLTKYLRDLDEKSRNLYDFQTPFRDMTGASSDNAIMDVIASRRAKKQNYKIKVLQTAKPDSYMSDPVIKNKILGAANFTIKINDTVIPIRFPGGTIYQLEDAIRKQVDDRIDIKTINDTTESAIIVLSGKETGEKNKLLIEGDVKTLYEIGLLTEASSKKNEFTVDFSTIETKTSRQIESDKTKVLIKPLDEGTVGLLDKNYSIQDNTIITFNASIRQMDLSKTNDDASGVSPFDQSLMEGVTVSNITVGGGSLITFYEEKKELPPVVSNFTEVFTVIFDDTSVKTFYIDQSGSFSNMLTTYKNKKVKGLLLRNQNTDRDYIVSDVRFSTKTEESGNVPKNAISRACDSIISLDGVEVRRDKNNIEDLVDGVTLNLNNESQNPVSITIDHNYQKVEESLTGWVDSYNKAMEYLYIVTKANQDRTPLHNRTPQTLKDGIFQTETSYTMLKNKLRNSAINAYPTLYGRELALLEQIGLFTKKSGNFSSESEEWNATKMGLLNIDLDKLKSALKTKFEGVEELFASDTDGDKVKNTGAAVSINQDLRLAIGIGNFVERRITYNDSRIKDNNKDIEEMNRKMGDYEITLRQKYGKMNQAITETDSKSKWLNNQFKGQ